MKSHWIAALLALSGVAGPVVAQSPFVPATDMRLRNDITLLADNGYLHLPINEWPLAREDVARAAARINPDDLHDAALQAALERVMVRVAVGGDVAAWRIRESSLTAGQPALLRGFDTPGREDAEFTLSGGASTERYGVRLSVTGAVHPADGHSLRLDGSDASVRAGNWLFSVNQIDRWWGPGLAGSLILSNNARPMPAISLDRVHSLPINLPFLRRLGPWRFSGFFGLGEKHRADLDRPLFMGMRLSFKPSRLLEFGLSRSAQFCGGSRRCTLGTFARMLVGQDNVHFDGLNDPADEPGNQMSGYDLRLVSPWKAMPAALYGQFIGEDASGSGLPMRFIHQEGIQTWRTLANGSVLRAYVEVSDTSTDVYRLWKPHDPQPGFRTDYAYRNHLFFAGYRYRGRNIGHSTDSDSRTTAAGLSLTTHGGARWAVQWLGGQLDRRGNPDVYNMVTFGPSKYRSVELSWAGRLAGQDLSVQIGHEKQSPTSTGSGNGMFGFVQWRKDLD